MINDKPYVISSDEFEAFYDYEKISLTYYADQFLADDDDELVDDIEETSDSNRLTLWEYEDDSVFVRNDRLSVTTKFCLTRESIRT